MTEIKRGIKAEQSTSLCDTKFKVVLLGDTGVGKTSIIDRFVRDQFDQASNSTVGIDFLSRNIVVQNRTYRLQLWDTAGQQKYKSLVPAYLRDANAAFFVYQPTRIQSLQNINSWLQLFRDNQSPTAKAVLVGTKMDLVDWGNPLKEKALELGQQQEIQVWEVSALTGKNINELFVATVAGLINGEKNEKDVYADKEVANLSALKRQKSSCCKI